MKNFTKYGIKDFSVAQTLECGQCFHFIKLDEDDYVLTAKGRALHIKQVGEDVTFFDTTEKEYENVWKNYFDLDRDYGEIKKHLLEKNPQLKAAIDSMWGVRILNQDFFETLISFIISQNKQIPHIKKIVADISERFGTYKGEYGGYSMYTFPDISQISKANVDDFKELKAGFRAPYIMDAIANVSANNIEEEDLLNATYEECIEALCKIKGVGLKVANCVALFSLNKREAFPIDVWIKRIMEAMYFDGKETSKEEITDKAKELFGDLGGYAQQYLFYYGKTVKMGVKSQKSTHLK